jgi:hypothetical protein
MANDKNFGVLRDKIDYERKKFYSIGQNILVVVFNLTELLAEGRSFSINFI